MSKLFPALLVIALALSACGGGEGDGDGSSASTSSPSSTTVVPQPVEERVEARFDIIGGPDWLTEADGSLWVKVDDGRVVRIDPQTNEVEAEIQAGSDSEICQGIGAGNGEVWTCDELALVRIDPATNEVAATVPVDKYYEQGQIPVAFDHAWALSGDGSTLVGVRDDAVDVEFDLGVRCVELVAVDDALWATCIEDGTAIRIDPETGEVTDRVEGFDGARSISADEGDLWVGHEDGVARIDTATAELVGVADVPTGLSTGVFASDGGVWVHTPHTLRRVDGDLEVVEEITIPEESSGSVRVAFDSVWTTAYDDAVVYRLSLE